MQNPVQPGNKKKGEKIKIPLALTPEDGNWDDNVVLQQAGLCSSRLAEVCKVPPLACMLTLHGVDALCGFVSV